MPLVKSVSVNLGLGALPQATNKELFEEMIRVYNAINILAQALDTYTGSGTLANDIASTAASLTSNLAGIKKSLIQVQHKIKGVPDYSASHFELRKAYYKYKVPSWHVTGETVLDGDLNVGADLTVAVNTVLVGKFGCNGKPSQASHGLGSTVTAPAGGVGTAAGGWDTAGNRDAAIAAINANATAIDDIRTALINNGIGA